MASARRRNGLRGGFAALGLAWIALAAPGCSNGSGGGTQPLAVETGVYAFPDGDSLSALAVSDAQPDTLYALQQGGTVRVLDLTTAPPTSLRTIDLAPLDPSGFPTAAAGLQIDAAERGGKLAGFATSTGRNANGTDRNAVYLFDASDPAATGPTDVFSLASVTITATGLQTSTGTADPVFSPSDPGASALAVLGDMLYVGCASLMPQSYLDNYPGVVLGFQLDPNDHTRFAAVTQPAQIVFTRGYNVTGLAAGRSPGGAPVLYVTTTGAGRSYFQASPFQSSPPGARDAYLEVLDPARGEIVAYFPFGPAQARGAAAVTPDGLEAVVGRGDFGFSRAELFRLSLLDVDLALAPGASTPVDLSGGILNGVANPIVIPFANPAQPPTGRFVSALAYNHDGSALYAISFNDSTLNEFRLRRDRTPVFRRQVRLSRGNETAQTFGPNASVLAVRPGVPGRDYTGADLWVGTIGITVDPQQFIQRAELDAIRTY